MEIKIEKTASETIVHFSGRLDTSTSAEAEKQLETLWNEKVQHLVLECSELEFISSSGLRLFLSMRKKAIAQQASACIRNMNAELKNIFVITGFVSFFPFE